MNNEEREAMARIDEDDFATCLECDEPVSPESGRSFPVGCEDLICMECALRRGGAYDEEEDRWVVAPEIGDLLSRAEAHAH